MPIPQNIEREHIFQAMLKIAREGIPNKRKGRDWAVDYEGVMYPCKLLISWANLYANGYELDPHPSNFTTYIAQNYLLAKKFNITQV